MEGNVRHPADSPRCPHLAAAICALAAVIIALTAVHLGVRWRLSKELPFFAAHAIPIKVNGNVLPAAAFRKPGELLVYGSSELDVWSENRADAFFRHRPSGFAVFAVGRGGASCLSILQKLAAAGEAARGKKVVIFLSPVWFVETDVKTAGLEANLGIAQIGGWIFNDTLKPSLKTAIARRMQDFPEELKNQELLGEAVQSLAAPSTLNRLDFALLAPIGKFQNALLGTLESCAILQEALFPQRRWEREGARDEAPPPATGGQIDWDKLGTTTDAGDSAPEYRTVYNSETRPRADSRIAFPGAGDRDFIAQLENSREFDDLGLLIRVLKEMELDAAFISQPFNGALRDRMQISASARRVYYERLERALKEAGYPLYDFSGRESDPNFFSDVEHPSAEAWLFYDREIDRFYSGKRD